MVLIQDQITVASDKLDALQQLFRERYVDAAAQRGLTLLETQVSPPLLLANGTATLWLRWKVADVGAWWAMRAQAGTPDVANFWQAVDELSEHRERVYLSGEAQQSLQSAHDISACAVGIRGHRETAQLALKEGITEDDKAALVEALQAAKTLEGLEAFSLAENLAPDYAAGHFTIDLLYRDGQSAGKALASAVWRDKIAPALTRYCEACHAVTLDTIGAGLRASGLSNSIKRTAFFRVLPGVAEDIAKRFEDDLLEMPAQIPEILNWRLSRAQPADWNTNDQPWTYVWEQEFESLDDLLGPYMINPHHWAHIDRWFDPESGVQAIDVDLSHAFSPLADSLITKEAK